MMEETAVKYPRRSRLHPAKFALYAAMASIIMMFASFTSAYLVRQAAGNWQEYIVPDIFYHSTAILLVSSVTLHYAYTMF
ncbi:MAG: cytochrome oxidase subunit III, partial [Saprospiraceae bacterium]|nr:cytochrome oxidase subunit III [Saprospiraceae bacterium]